MPWSAIAPEEAALYWKSKIEDDNREHGTSAEPEHGWKSWGPVSSEVGIFEFKRLTDVYSSIESGGYQRSNDPNGDMEGFVLSRDLDYRILVTTGHHRCAALAALGRTAAPFRLSSGRIVRRSEVGFWPNVQSGLFTQAQALALFDRLFDGRQPAGCHWPP
jgi:hypothetical protein